MIINQNILATLLTFSNLQKNFYDKLYTKETTFKTTTTGFISKIPNKKIPNFQVIKKIYGSFLWKEFNCLKARATSRRQFTFYY